jgi:hypothetical protein
MLVKLFNQGPLAKLDKALGYEPGDSRFEFWAVHQKGKENVRLATKIIATKISYIFFYNCFYNFINFNFCIIKNYE